MSATTCLPGLHSLNSPTRTWPETNCYLDLWIGLLHAHTQDPLPLMGAAAGMRWEGDHFTFIKPNAADLFTLTDIVLQEMALWDRLETHAALQLARGVIPLPEVDAFFLPDTANHGHQHTKTTIAITAIDPAAQQLHYIHNGGTYRLVDNDYRGVLGLTPHQSHLFPYAELAHLPPHPPPPRRDAARAVLTRLAATRGPTNPVHDFLKALPDLLPGRADQVHALCFNTLRQLGAGFGLLADHLAWLDEDGTAAALLADQSKTAQFLLARAARRTRPDAALVTAIEQMAETWVQSVAAF